MLDYLLISYFVWRTVKGYTNGVGQEVKNLFFTLLFLCGVLGIYILSELTGLIQTTLQTFLDSTGFWASIGSIILAVFIFFFIRGKVAAYAEDSLNSQTGSYVGALIGAFRSTVVIYLLVIFLNIIPLGLFSDSLNSSEVARPFLDLMDLHKQPDKGIEIQDTLEHFNE